MTNFWGDPQVCTEACTQTHTRGWPWSPVLWTRFHCLEHVHWLILLCRRPIEMYASWRPFSQKYWPITALSTACTLLTHYQIKIWTHRLLDNLMSYNLMVFWNCYIPASWTTFAISASMLSSCFSLSVEEVMITTRLEWIVPKYGKELLKCPWVDNIYVQINLVFKQRTYIFLKNRIYFYEIMWFSL